MSFAVGTRIGIYEVLSALGARGMGKVLLPSVANDPDRLAIQSRSAGAGVPQSPQHRAHPPSPNATRTAAR